MLPSNGSVQDPVFIFGSYSENMEEFLDTNIGLQNALAAFQKNVRSVLNALLYSDLINEVRTR